MKRIFFFTLIVCPIFGYAQLDIGFSAGATKLRALSKDVTTLSTKEIGLYLSKDINFDGISFNPQLNILTATYIMDGIFYNGNENSFGTTPLNSKQSKIDFYLLRIPLYFKALLMGIKEENKYSTISFGPTIDYVILAKQEYKINNAIKKENASLDYKFNTGLAFEINMYTPMFKNKLFVFGTGFNYSLTDYLKENKSFKPMSFFFKFGLSMLKQKNRNKIQKYE